MADTCVEHRDVNQKRPNSRLHRLKKPRAAAMTAPKYPPRKRIALIGFITIGLPFAGFKILFGWAMPQLWQGNLVQILGIALIALGTADLAVNLLNLFSYLLRGRALMQVCVLANIFHLFGRKEIPGHEHRIRSADFGTALDVMLSFTLVALAVGLNLLPRFGETERQIWNTGVVINVLGAGISRIMVSVLRAD